MDVRKQRHGGINRLDTIVADRAKSTMEEVAAKHDELKIDNIEALATDLATFEQMPF